MLAPTLRDPSDLLNKLLREEKRLFLADHPKHVADHLYNFCVTSTALRDCVFEARGLLDDRAKAPFHKEWGRDPARVACSEIANIVKHTTLRTREGTPRERKTKAAAEGTGKFVDVYKNASGALAIVPTTRPTLIVHLSNDTTVEAWQLTRAVIAFWRAYFSTHGLAHTEQPDAELFGIVEGEHEWTDPRDGTKWQVRAYDAGPAAAAVHTPDAFEDAIRFRSDPATYLIPNDDARRPDELSDEELQDLLDAARAR